MTEQMYNRLANVLMLIAIASALLFDSGRLPHGVVGTIGILAGVAALALYFWNQYKSSPKEESHSCDRENTVAPLAAVDEKPPNLPKRTDSLVHDALFLNKGAALRAGDFWRVAVSNSMVDDHRRRTAQAWLGFYGENYARSLRWSFAKGDDRILMQPEVELSVNEVAACALEIMRNLAIADDFTGEWEYSFGPKGLRVSLRKPHSARSVPPQEDFDFGNVSSLLR